MVEWQGISFSSWGRDLRQCLVDIQAFRPLRPTWIATAGGRRSQEANAAPANFARLQEKWNAMDGDVGAFQKYLLASFMESCTATAWEKFAAQILQKIIQISHDILAWADMYGKLFY